MLSCMPFILVFGHSAILPDDISFEHEIHSQVHDTTIHAI